MNQRRVLGIAAAILALAGTLADVRAAAAGREPWMNCDPIPRPPSTGGPSAGPPRVCPPCLPGGWEAFDPSLPNAYSRLHYNFQYLPKILERIGATAPAGSDLKSWRY